MRALIAVLVTGCWGNPPPATASVANIAPADAPATNSLPAHTVWDGRYECAQGVTALKLTLDIEPDGRARAIFDFGPLADNPTLPNGSFRMRGTAKPVDDAIDIHLQPDEWIDRPDNYEMVGLHAGVDASRRGIRGRILNDACDWLDAKRAD